MKGAKKNSRLTDAGQGMSRRSISLRFSLDQKKADLVLNLLSKGPKRLCQIVPFRSATLLWQVGLSRKAPEEAQPHSLIGKEALDGIGCEFRGEAHTETEVVSALNRRRKA